MKKVLSIFLALFLCNVALSQWNFNQIVHAGAITGITVDANNRLWLCGRSAPDILVYDLNQNPPALLATISELGGTALTGATDAARGMNIGNDGKVLYSHNPTGSVYAIDPANFSAGITSIAAVKFTPLNNETPGGALSLAAPATDEYGNIVTVGVGTGNPGGVWAYDADGNSLGTFTLLGGNLPGNCRDVAISADGNDLFITANLSPIQHWRNLEESGVGENRIYTFQRTFPGNCSEVFYDDANKRLWLGIETPTPARFDCWDLSGAEPVLLESLTLTSVGTGSSVTGGFATIRGSWFGGNKAYIGDNYARVLEFEYEASTGVSVTIRANTATVPDTLGATSFVQIRGESPFTWDGNSVLMKNVGGDYWEATIKDLTPGTTIQYKFFTNAFNVDGNGWEANTNHSSNNRILVVPDADVVLPIEFVNGIRNGLPQDYTPLTKGNDDSIAVMFRVNMRGNSDFNKDRQFVGVRGGWPGNDWGRNFILKRETEHGNPGQSSYDGTNFWSGVAKMPKITSAGEVLVGKEITYKFVIMDAEDENENVWVDGKNERGADIIDAHDGNRWFVLGGDTTLHWKWWNDGAPVTITGTDTVIVTYRADLSTAITSRGYTPGDTIEVRSGYESAKHYLSSDNPSIKPLVRIGITGQIYGATDTLIGELGGKMYYQYYLWKNGSEQKETFYNFDGTTGQLAERRFITLSGTTQWSNTAINDVVANSVSDMRRQPDFPNNQYLTRDVTVKLVCDLRPAYYTLLAGYELQSSQNLESIFGQADAARLYDELGVYVSGPMAGGWDWGAALRDSTSRKMRDDGQNGDDVAGDRKYTVLIQLGPSAGTDRQRRVGQEYKFGIFGEDNEGGYGNNHLANVDDATGTFTIEIPFGSIDPRRYPGWDYERQQPTIDVNKLDVVPDVYTLEQNYPNPFNPSTIIRYDIPKSSNVSLRIYDVMGREVSTLVNDVQSAGRYEVMFSAKNLSSGVYFYRLTADDFTAIKKMILMK